MSTRHDLKQLIYFTIEDESMLAEAFSGFAEENFAIAYKLAGTDDVFVAPWDTQQAMERNDVPYHQLAQEDSTKIAIYHTPTSEEELADYEDALKALALACRGIALACVGINGEVDLGFDLSDSTKRYTYFTAPAGHTFIWRIFTQRDEAIHFLDRLTLSDKEALNWARSIPLESSAELATYH